MKLLALDSSTNVCSICITDNRRVVGEYVTDSSLTHTERIMPAIEFLFSHLDWDVDQLNGLAVIHGPGSFTGLRISLSVIKGLSFALKCPVVTANALEIAAHQIEQEGWICPAVDAKRGEIFTCLFEKKAGQVHQKTEPKSVSPIQWKEELPAVPIFFCGPGAGLYFDVLRNNENSRLLFTDFILAKTLAQTAYTKFQSGEVVPGSEIKAAYLRPSDAETKGPRPPKQLSSIPRR